MHVWRASLDFFRVAKVPLPPCLSHLSLTTVRSSKSGISTSWRLISPEARDVFFYVLYIFGKIDLPNKGISNRRVVRINGLIVVMTGTD